MKVLENLVIPKEISLPVQAYWNSRNQVEILSSTAEISRFGVTSTADEWLMTGKTSGSGFDNVTY